MAADDDGKPVWPAYVMWLLPAVLGAALDWSGWLILLLLIPGLGWYGVTEGRRCYKKVRSSNPDAPVGQRVPMLYVLPLLIPALWFSSRFSGLLVVAGFVYVDLWMWIRRGSRRRAAGERW
jgi:hypothetical protein